NDLRFEESHDGFRERVVVGISTTAYRRFDTCFGQAFGVANAEVLHAAVAVVDERTVRFAIMQRLLQPSSARSLRYDVLARQPTMRRENTSITNATYTKPRHVARYVKSDTHS